MPKPKLKVKQYTDRSCSKCSLNRRAAALRIHVIAADKLDPLIFLDNLVIAPFSSRMSVEERQNFNYQTV
jgi:hypothetical protein